MMSKSPTCLLRSHSQPAATSGGLHEGAQDEIMRALTSSISFGRYASESFACEKWSSFTSNRYLEEAKKSSKPGSVKEMKAYFESHYKKIAANKASALLEHPTEEEAAKEVDQLVKEDLNTADSAVVDKENSPIPIPIPFPPKVAVEEEEEGAPDLNTEGNFEMEMETVDSAVVNKENSPIPIPIPFSPKVAVEDKEEEGARDLNTEGSYEMEMETVDSAVINKENSPIPIPFPPKVAVEEEEGACDLNTDGSYEMEMETVDSAVDNKENSPIPFPPKVAVVVEKEEEYKENIVNIPVPLKAAAEGDEEENQKNIVNIPVPFKKPKAAAVKEEKKKKPTNYLSKPGSINGSKPSNPLPPPLPPPLRSQPKPIAQNKTPLPQTKKEAATRIQQIRKEDSTPVKLKKTDGNLLKIRSLSGPSTSFAAKHKELPQTIAADNRKEKENRILPSPAKHRVQVKKVDNNNLPEKKRPSSSSTTFITVGKKSDNSKTQLPTIDDHQYIEKKKKKSSTVQEMSQRPPWRFSFKCSPERRNGGRAEAFPVNSMTPRKKRIFR